MKKLVALMVCGMLALPAFSQKKQAPKMKPSSKTQARVEAQVDNKVQREMTAAEQQQQRLKKAAARTVQVKLLLDNVTEEGKAVIVGFTKNYKEVMLVQAESFSYDELLDDPGVNGSLVGGSVVSQKGGTVKDAKWLQQYSLTQFTVPCELKGVQLQNAKKIPSISVEEAASLAKAMDTAQRDREAKRRKSVIVFP